MRTNAQPFILEPFDDNNEFMRGYISRLWAEDWDDEPGGTWFRPSGCESNACPEVAFDGDCVLVRASLRPGRVAAFSRREWDLLRQAIKAGEFDHGADEGGTE